MRQQDLRWERCGGAQVGEGAGRLPAAHRKQREGVGCVLAGDGVGEMAEGLRRVVDDLRD